MSFVSNGRRKAALISVFFVLQACIVYYFFGSTTSTAVGFQIERLSTAGDKLFSPTRVLSSADIDAGRANSSLDKKPQAQSFEFASVHVTSASTQTWKKGSFCENFVEKQFVKPIGVCGQQVFPEHAIKCLHTPRNANMVYCTVENAAVLGPRKAHIEYRLLEGEKKCPNPSVDKVHKTTGRADPAITMLDKLTAQKTVPTSICQMWINKTVFLYTGKQFVHIYFRMNAYYNLHKAIISEGVEPGEFVIIRLSRNSPKMTYLFPEWEKKLFPELVHIDELPNVTLCFRKAVLVPHAFAGIPFRCKMESGVRSECFNCKGKGLYGSSFYTFRQRVISSCGLVDSNDQAIKRITLISRTPYQRWKGDKENKFQRVLSNEKELVSALRSKFPHTNTTVAHMETLPICTQIQLAQEADVVMGVHGAGLVHLWWLQEDALTLELNPTFELSNPTFKMLSTLAGRNYRSITLSSSSHKNVKVSVDTVIQELRAHTSLS